MTQPIYQKKRKKTRDFEIVSTEERRGRDKIQKERKNLEVLGKKKRGRPKLTQEGAVTEVLREKVWRIREAHEGRR